MPCFVGVHGKTLFLRRLLAPIILHFRNSEATPILAYLVLEAINTITCSVFLILLVVKLTEFAVRDACEEMNCSKESEEVLLRRSMAVTVGITLVIFGIGLGMWQDTFISHRI